VSLSFSKDLSHEAKDSTRKAKDSTLKAKTKDFKIVLEDPRGRGLVLEDSNIGFDYVIIIYSLSFHHSSRCIFLL